MLSMCDVGQRASGSEKFRLQRVASQICASAGDLNCLFVFFWFFLFIYFKNFLLLHSLDSLGISVPTGTPLIVISRLGIFFWVLPDGTGFPWVLLGSTGIYWDLLGFTRFYRVLLGFTGFYWVSLGFTGFYLVLLGFTRFYRVLLGSQGFIGFY